MTGHDRGDAARAALVVLSWNGADDTLRCLESLDAHASGAVVVLVDNGSTDATVRLVRERFADVVLIEAGQNLGFSRGNNLGIEWALAEGYEVVGILNNDTVVEPGFLEPLLDAIDERPDAYVSPLIRYLDDPERIWFAGASVDPDTGIFVHRTELDGPDRLIPTPMVTGCALLAHRRVWERVGLLDPDYFLIFEDAEWSLRADAAGCAGLVATDSVIHHAVSATIRSGATSAADYYYARNGVHFLRSAAGRPPGEAARFVLANARRTLRELRVDPNRRNLAKLAVQARGFADGYGSRMGPAPAHGFVGRVVARPGPTALDRQKADDRPAGERVRALAFYLPQFHPIPENDEWWGPGFTEWTNTAKARPRFPGHYQPHVPADLGYYDLRLPESRAAQAELASRFGVEGFLYWHYWFAGRRILERPFDEVLGSGEPKQPFALAWANQTWSGIWHGAPDQVLIEQTYPGADDDQAHFDSLLGAFTDPRYVTVGGRPLFYVFRPEQLPEPAAWVDRWQRMAQDAGLPGLYLIAEMSDLVGAGPIYPDPFADGFDAGVHVRIPVDRSPAAVLRMKVLRKLGRPEVYRYTSRPVPRPASTTSRPVYPCVYPNWDNTPRSGARGLVAHASTPAAFERHVADAVDRLQVFEPERRLLFVKSWNEWAEGNHLEPDRRDGLAYLEALARGGTG